MRRFGLGFGSDSSYLVVGLGLCFFWVGLLFLFGLCSLFCWLYGVVCLGGFVCF